MIEFIREHAIYVLCFWGIVIAWMFWANARPYKPPKKFLEQQREAALKRESERRNHSSYLKHRNHSSSSRQRNYSSFSRNRNHSVSSRQRKYSSSAKTGNLQSPQP